MRNKEYNKRFEGKPLDKIVQNRDEEGHILTYSLFHKMSNGMIIEIEQNTRQKLKCFEVKE